jgi:hypothetical protein
MQAAARRRSSIAPASQQHGRWCRSDSGEFPETFRTSPHRKVLSTAALGSTSNEPVAGYPLIIGGLAGVCGLVLVVQPSAGLSVVRWILTAYMLISGASEAALAWRLRPDDGWAETLGGAVVSIIAGLVLLYDWPISGARAVGLLVGAKLISSGWALMRVHRALESAGDKLRAAKQAFAQRSAP